MTAVKQLLVYLFIFANTANIFAHALFIKTNGEGKKGEAQDVFVFYAEPHDGKRELIKDWWSNTKDFTLWLTHPNGIKEKIITQQRNNHFSASFTPKTDGRYYFSIHHNVASLYGKTQYQFNTSTSVEVGKPYVRSKLIKTKEENLLLMYKSFKNDNIISIYVENRGVPLADISIKVFAPNGWQKDIKTNTEGIASFKVELQVPYLLEASKKEDVENEEYINRMRIVTTFVTH
ncbi:hypothetical protein CW731_04515 [Polaribacter sp. ALD11]|uniref:hypothetical protein n=1 Tax=Polaribacter sp. ALD11 TaxID=2058137 RepID=UPI000C31492E|nr:hypothetical protein [Polaribacter sp. ALD11]AUC84609.1 hypothetical protein CW731_04515 [Polaribacter sp. ALD11]